MHETIKNDLRLIKFNWENESKRNTLHAIAPQTWFESLSKEEKWATCVWIAWLILIRIVQIWLDPLLTKTIKLKTQYIQHMTTLVVLESS